MSSLVIMFVFAAVGGARRYFTARERRSDFQALAAVALVR
jgi:hypothetical protein